jgi:hypothetical protein
MVLIDLPSVCSSHLPIAFCAVRLAFHAGFDLRSSAPLLTSALLFFAGLPNATAHPPIIDLDMSFLGVLCPLLSVPLSQLQFASGEKENSRRKTAVAPAFSYQSC